MLFVYFYFPGAAFPALREKIWTTYRGWKLPNDAFKAMSHRDSPFTVWRGRMFKYIRTVHQKNSPLMYFTLQHRRSLKALKCQPVPQQRTGIRCRKRPTWRCSPHQGDEERSVRGAATKSWVIRAVLLHSMRSFWRPRTWGLVWQNQWELFSLIFHSSGLFFIVLQC